MKKLDVTAITDAIQLPIKRGTLQFLQDSHKECISDLIIGLIGNYSATVAYILSGVVNSTSGGSTYTLSAGVIFYNGELYEVDATTFTVTTGTAVLNFVTTQYATYADPITFTDLTPRNIHNIVKIVIAEHATGTGISDYADCQAPFYAQRASLLKKVIPIGDWNMNYTIAGANHKIVTHGITDFTKIRSVKAIIRNDTNDYYAELPNTMYVSTVQFQTIVADATTIRLDIDPVGSIFNTNLFDSISYNRGFIEIEYVE